jgi:hypothetical protein
MVDLNSQVSYSFDKEAVNPSTPQHKCKGSGLTLSGALNPALKGGAFD